MSQTILSPSDNQPRLQGYLDRLGSVPPTSLLLEGGVESERRALALYWAARLNCPEAAPPCRQCPTCHQIAEEIFRDLIVLNGREEAIRIDPVRVMRQELASLPEYGGWRVVVIHEAQSLTQEAANALLKSLEEPPPGNVFVLTTTQRQWLLPTLVSRSWPFTLNWQEAPAATETDEAIWMERLLSFWRTSQGLFEHTSRKGELDTLTVRAIIAQCQRELLTAMTRPETESSQLAALFQARLSPQRLPLLDQTLHKAQEALEHNVNPSLVCDWLALQIWRAIHSKRR
ncbi:MAG: DNA polymerase III subunit delta' [Thermodesulfobacteriota bacterium]